MNNQMKRYVGQRLEVSQVQDFGVGQSPDACKCVPQSQNFPNPFVRDFYGSFIAYAWLIELLATDN